MNNHDVEQQVSAFCEEWQGLSMVYDDYARSVGIPYMTLFILTMIENTDICTQKIICEKTFLPKQTVNAIVTGLCKKGYVALHEIPEDRRNKAIRLTKSGKAYAAKVIPHIRQAEIKAMRSLSPAERKQLLDSIRRYGDAFRTAMQTEGGHK